MTVHSGSDDDDDQSRPCYHVDIIDDLDGDSLWVESSPETTRTMTTVSIST